MSRPERMDETVPHTGIHESYRNMGAWQRGPPTMSLVGRQSADNPPIKWSSDDDQPMIA